MSRNYDIRGTGMITEWISAVSSAVTAIGVVFAFVQLVGARKASHREFENLYVTRYWQLLDRSPDVLLNSQTQSWTNLEIRKRHLLSAYLHLCEDEIDIRSSGYVTSQTWQIWAAAIQIQCEHPLFQAALENEPLQFGSLRQLIASGKDPLRWSRAHRWLHGL